MADDQQDLSGEDFNKQQQQPFDISSLCLTPAAWETRVIPAEDKLLGPFSTTTRTEISADTGLGKTMLGLGRAHAIRLGKDFMHWRRHREGRALYLDGEMPPELTQQRIKLARSWFKVSEPITDPLAFRRAGYAAARHLRGRAVAAQFRR
jgi:RecA-family ATPase